jgi:hypothetical protein
MAMGTCLQPPVPLHHKTNSAAHQMSYRKHHCRCCCIVTVDYNSKQEDRLCLGETQFWCSAAERAGNHCKRHHELSLHIGDTYYVLVLQDFIFIKKRRKDNLDSATRPTLSFRQKGTSLPAQRKSLTSQCRLCCRIATTINKRHPVATTPTSN